MFEMVNDRYVRWQAMSWWESKWNFLYLQSSPNWFCADSESKRNLLRERERKVTAGCGGRIELNLDALQFMYIIYMGAGARLRLSWAARHRHRLFHRGNMDILIPFSAIYLLAQHQEEKRFHALVVLPLRRPPPTHSSVWAAIAATPLLPHRRTLAMPPLLATNLVHARS